MIAPARRHGRSTWQRRFLELLPAIQRFARFAFRHLEPVSREEAVAEAVAAALVAYHRLFQLGRQQIAYASPLARFAVLHVLSGRHIGGRQNHTDVLSRSAQRRHGFGVLSLNRADRNGTQWVEKLVTQDRRCGPAEVAATRIDFRSWLATLAPRRREIARALASGETTKSVARRFGVSQGRISQIRRELDQSWRCLQAQAAELEGRPIAERNSSAA
jgi:hypothetical protein